MPEAIPGGAILKFDGPYRFLSNFYPVLVTYEGTTYPTSEHAFQAAKVINEEDRRRVIEAGSAGEAKRLGRVCALRDDWEQVKVQVMYKIVKAKFSGPLKGALLATDGMVLVEGNTWHDNTWGVCGCERCGGVGANLLGNILVQVRTELLAADAPRKVVIPPAPRSDWEGALAALDNLINLCGEVDADDGVDYADDVRMSAESMRDWIEAKRWVSDAQITAIENWTDGIHRWIH